MGLAAVVQLATMAVATLAIIWHLWRTTRELRDRLNEVEQRLTRIETYLGIGLPGAAASEAPGAALAGNHADVQDHPKAPGKQSTKPAAHG